MTVSSTTRKAGPYAGTGALVAYTFDFKVFSAVDLYVTRTNPAAVDQTLTLGSDYTVALNADQDTSPGGSVTLTTPLPIDFKLTLTSSVAALQPIDITNSGGFYPDIIEAALDRQTILTQQVVETLGRSITLPVSLDPSISTQLGAPVPNGVLAWNGAGDQLITTTPEALAVSVNSDDVRAALLAATIVNGDNLHAPSGNAVFDALAEEAALRDAADDNLNALIVIEANNRINAVNTLNSTVATLAALVPAGAIVDFDLDAAPAGFVYADGGTIGDASSGATTRANADTFNLFAAQWARNATLRPLFDSAGAPVARGASAAADFAAHRRIQIGDLRDRVARGYKSGGLGPGVGALQDDALQGHAHGTTGRPNTGSNGGHISTSCNTDTDGTKPGYTETLVSDGVHGTVTVADETRVKSFGTLKCYKL